MPNARSSARFGACAAKVSQPTSTCGVRKSSLSSDNGPGESPHGQRSQDTQYDVPESADATTRLRQDIAAVPVCQDPGRGRAESLRPDEAHAGLFGALSRPSSAGPHGTPG